ncbi:uncharacterized protein LOC121976248 isoform X1 [Zingiber officinale]|nr:uncharacterized protein LOC121976248 isoform X1 [Zingiber officinale]XP_042384325.1 uncharacterized protein LOC121976248 isoform X1 [Zingiber officinale]
MEELTKSSRAHRFVEKNMLSMDFASCSSMQSGGQFSTQVKIPVDLLPNVYDYTPIMEGSKSESNDFIRFVSPRNLLLAMSLGQSSTTGSISRISSAKETDEESSAILELNYQLHLGSSNISSNSKSSVTSPKVSHTGKLFGLEVSPSTGSSESALSNANHLTTGQQLKSLNSSVVANPVLISNEERSTGTCWIFGACLGPGQSNLETASSSFAMQMKMCAEADSTSAVLDFPSTNMQSLKNPVFVPSGVSNSQKHSKSIKHCQFQGCTKGARGASGLCIAHGGGRRCQRLGCQKGAEGRTIYCKAHGGGLRCQFLGCTKGADGRTDYCIAHGGGRRCSHPTCIRAARGKSGLCIRHGGGKRCQREDCTRSAEGSSGLCISHGGGRRCHFKDCTKGAQGSTLFCKAHGGGKRCTFPECTKGAEGSTLLCKGHGGGKRCSYQEGGDVCPKSVHGGTPFCVAHGGGKRCSVAGCIRSARGRTSFCVRHGGGKRCKFDGCDKSAQGRTDFCKAHGGGRRCSWGQVGSLCEKSARGKTSLCAVHDALVRDHRVHGGGMVRPKPDPTPTELDEMKAIVTELGPSVKLESKEAVHGLLSQSEYYAFEGRVRGASLISTITANATYL